MISACVAMEQHDFERLRTRGLLPLMAPREQGGREVRRMAMSYWPSGLFLRRIRIWLHHPAIKMPAGVAEHGQNDAQADEGRQ
jgi:hypothetical protein